MFGIIGSGFGLYGHLPAIANLNTETICLPARYQEAFERRTELAMFSNRLLWLEDEQAVLKKVESLVVAVWPGGQERWVAECIRYRNLRKLYLEKPLGTTPEIASDLLRRLVESGKQIRIIYSFLHTDWYSELKRLWNENKLISLNIHWSFCAHHYQHHIKNWKSQHDLGGGALRFYGIHLLALFADLNIEQVKRSSTFGVLPSDVARWELELNHPKNSPILVTVDSHASQSSFKLVMAYSDSFGQAREWVLDKADPFFDLSGLSKGLDPRTQLLKRMYNAIDENQNNSCIALYQSINALWHDTELKNSHICLT